MVSTPAQRAALTAAENAFLDRDLANQGRDLPAEIPEEKVEGGPESPKSKRGPSGAINLRRNATDLESLEAERHNRQVREQHARQPVEVMSTPVSNEPPTRDHTAGTQAGCGAQGHIPSTPTPDTPDFVKTEGNKRKFPADRPTICPTGVPTGETAASRDSNNGSELREEIEELNTNPVEEAGDHEGATVEPIVTNYHAEGSAIPTVMPTTTTPTTSPLECEKCYRFGTN